MYERIKEYFNELMTGKILSVSGSNNFYQLIDMEASEITEVEYPNVDMQNLPFNDETFDFVLSDQVIEHVENPQKAIQESYRVLKKGGTAIHTTCFMNYLHSCPKDFFRFSPDALRYLCRDFSEILQCEGWGNRIALVLCFINERFRFMNIPERKWSVRHLIATWNEKRYSIVTWIVIKK
jgi:ubiquinone/menaquinone biosynthesis C-methylase UbiE